MPELIEIITGVATATLTSESSVDDALANTARLVISTREASRQLGLPAHVIQPALDDLERAFVAQNETRRAIAAYHGNVGAVARRLGATPQGYGDLWPCPQFQERPRASRSGRSAETKDGVLTA